MAAALESFLSAIRLGIRSGSYTTAAHMVRCSRTWTNFCDPAWPVYSLKAPSAALRASGGVYWLGRTMRREPKNRRLASSQRPAAVFGSTPAVQYLGVVKDGFPGMMTLDHSFLSLGQRHVLVCFPVPLISWITILFGPIVSDSAYVSGFGNIRVSDSFGQRYVPASLFDQLDYVGSLCIYECA